MIQPEAKESKLMMQAERFSMSPLPSMMVQEIPQHVQIVLALREDPNPDSLYHMALRRCSLCRRKDSLLPVKILIVLYPGFYHIQIAFPLYRYVVAGDGVDKAAAAPG